MIEPWLCTSGGELERLLFQAIAAADLPEPQRQFPLPGRHPRREVVDVAYPDAMIIVEADGRRWHSRLRDVRRDHARDAEASLAGWITLRFTYEAAGCFYQPGGPGPRGARGRGG